MRFIGELFTRNLALDLGTDNTVICDADGCVLLNEPSVIALRGSGTVEAVGTEASEMRGRAPGKYHVIRPLRNGAVSMPDAAASMLRGFIRKIGARQALRRLRVVLAVPDALTDVQRFAATDAVSAAGAHDVRIVSSALAAAIGADLPVVEPFGQMIVDVGGGITEVAVFSLAGVAYYRAVPIGSDAMDSAVIAHVERAHNLAIGERSAERIRVQLCNGNASGTARVTGRCLRDGIPRHVVVGGAEMRQSLSNPVAAITGAIRRALEQTPAELSADLITSGIVMTGGGSLMSDLTDRVCRETGLPVRLAKEPLASVALGVSRMLKHSRAHPDSRRRGGGRHGVLHALR